MRDSWSANCGLTATARPSWVMRALALALMFFSPPAYAQQDVIPPKVLTMTPGGINISDGSLVYSQTDLSMGPLALERYYRGGFKQPNDPMFGSNFSSNFDIYVARTSGTNASNIVHIGNSASGTYSTTATSGNYGGLDGDAQKGTLTTNGSQYIYTDNSGTIYTFSATVSASGTPFTGTSRRVERIDFPDGRRQTFSYTAAGQPRLVEDSSGYAILFDYNASNDVSAACIFKRSETYVSTSSTCAGASLKTSYGYTLSAGSYKLTSATDVLNQTTTIAYSGSFISCITPPGYGSCQMSLTGNPLQPGTLSFYVTQTLADQGTWTVSGSLMENGDGGVLCTNGNMEAGAASPSGQGNVGGTFTNSSPYTLSDQLGRTTSFTFEGGVPYFPPIGSCNPSSYGSMLREATYPEGDKYQADYNGPLKSVTSERRVPKGGGTPLEKLYQYGNSCTASPGTFQNCTKPTATRDAAGNWTNYTYASHGGVLTVMAPAPVASGARPLTVTTWVQRYAWIKNSGGVLVQASLPVWVKNTETVCQTVAGSSPSPVCDSSALQTVTTYEYGANGTGQSLLVKGVVVSASGTSLRTCYGYDLSDRKIYETQPNANPSSCS